MVDFDRQPDAKSAEEQEFDALCMQYEEKFGKQYFLAVGLNFNTLAETLEDLRQRIANNNPQQNPDYEPGQDY